MEFEKWYRDKAKNKIERSMTRHPMMTMIRKSADEKVIKFAKNYPFFNSSLLGKSVYDPESKIPNIFDKIYYHSQMIVLKIKNKNISKKIASVFIFFKDKINHKRDQFDSVYEKIIKSNSENMIQIESKKRRFEIIRKLKFITIINLFNSKSDQIFNDDIGNKLIDNYNLNKKVYSQLKMYRFINFWREVCFIKPTFIVELKPEKKIEKVIDVKNYETIFYKLYKMLEYKTNFSYYNRIVLNFLKKRKTPILITTYIAASVATLYKMNKNRFQENIILEKVLTQNDVFKPIIFDFKKDSEFLEMIKIENEIYNSDVEKLSKDIESLEKINEKKISLKQKNELYLKKEFLQLKNEIILRQSTLIATIWLILIGHITYKLIMRYRKKQTFTNKQFLLRNIGLLFLMGHFTNFLHEAEVIKSKNLISQFNYKDNLLDFYRYNFYKENLIKLNKII